MPLSTDTPTVLRPRRGVVNLSVDPENRSLRQSGGLCKASGDAPGTSCAVILSPNLTETVTAVAGPSLLWGAISTVLGDWADGWGSCGTWGGTFLEA